MGEILVEVATDVAFGHGVPAQLGISGDALNVAAAAAAAGARTGLLAVLTDDDLGQAIAARIRELGISDELLKFRTGQQGVYLVHCDPDGQREFSYARSRQRRFHARPGGRRSGRLLGGGGGHCRRNRLRHFRVVAGSGPQGCGAGRPLRLRSQLPAPAHLRGGGDGGPRRTGAADLPGHSRPSRAKRPHSSDCDPPKEAAAKLRGLGAANVAVTCGAEGIQLDGDLPNGGHDSSWVDAIPAPSVVDQTGAGDAFVGTLTARMVLGDTLPAAARFGAAAASLVVGGKGGTGFIPTFEQTSAHALRTPEGELSSHA